MQHQQQHTRKYGPGGRKHKWKGMTSIAIVTLLAIASAQAAPLNGDAGSDNPHALRNVHPLSRRSVDAPLLTGGASADGVVVKRSDAPGDHVKRQTGARQGIVAVPAASSADDDADTATSAVAAAVSSTPAAVSTVVRAAAATSSSVASLSSAPASSTSASASSSSSSQKSSSATSSSSTASPSSTNAHTGFTLTDTQNKLYPLWIVVVIAGTFAGLFVILCTVRWCIFRPHGKQDPDAYLTGGAASGSRGRSIRAGAKSLRKALTKRKLAGSSFARRKEEGSVLLEVGDEVFAVPPSVAEEYQAAKKMFGGGSQSGSSNGHSSASTPGGNPFSWNGKAYLAQCLARHEADKKRAPSGARSGTTQMNIDAWTRSTSTLITDEKTGGSRNQAYGAKRFDDGDDNSNKPKRGLSGRLAAGLRAAIGGNRDADGEDDELGDPEKTTDLSTFLPVVNRHAAKNGWTVTPRPNDPEERIVNHERANRRISSSTFRAAPTPVQKDTPQMGGAGHRVGQYVAMPSNPPRPSPAVLQKSSAQQTRMQPRGVGQNDGPPRDDIRTRRFPHDPVLLHGQQRSGTVKKVRVNSTAEAIGTPIWEQNARRQPTDRVVSSPAPAPAGGFQPGQMIAHGTMPQQANSAGVGRDRLRETRAASAQYQQRRQPSQKAHTMRISPQHQARRGGGEEVRLDRGRE